jgi:hypothetical protein
MFSEFVILPKSLEIEWSVIPQKSIVSFSKPQCPTDVLLRDFQPIVPSFGTNVSIKLTSFSEEARVALQAEKPHLTFVRRGTATPALMTPSSDCGTTKSCCKKVMSRGEYGETKWSSDRSLLIHAVYLGLEGSFAPPAFT